MSDGNSTFSNTDDELLSSLERDLGIVPKDEDDELLSSLEKDLGIVTEPTEKLVENEDWTNAWKQSIGQPMDALADTADVFGFKKVGDTLRELSPDVDDNYVSAGYRFSNPKKDDFQVLGFAPEYIPRALAEQSGQIGGSIASSYLGATVGRQTGALIGGLSGPQGAIVGAGAGGSIGRYGGPFLFEALQVIGPTAKERAKNQGREEPNNEDILAALTTAAGSGALNALGQKFLPGGGDDIAPFVTKLRSSFLGEGLTETGQSIVEQVGGTLGTVKGLAIDLKQAVAEGLLGGFSGGAATSVEAGAKKLSEAFTQKEEEKKDNIPQEAVLPSPAIQEITAPLETPTIVEEKRGGIRIDVTKPQIVAKIEAMEEAAEKEEQRKQLFGITGEDATKTAAERLQEQSDRLEARNIPNEAVKVVQNQIEQAKPQVPALKTAEQVLTDKAPELDRKDIQPIELDETTLEDLRSVNKNEAKPEAIKRLKDKGLVYDVENELVITEPARLALGSETALSEKSRLEQIRDRFTVTNEELNNTTDDQLAAGIRVSQSALPRLSEDFKPRANESLKRLRTELLRRSQELVDSKAGPRAIIDDKTLTGVGNSEQATTFVAAKVDEAQRRNLNIDYVNPVNNTITKITGFNPSTRKLVGVDQDTKETVNIPMAPLFDGVGRLELFSPAKSRSRNKEEIAEPVTRKYDPLPVTTAAGEVEINVPNNIVKAQSLISDIDAGRVGRDPDSVNKINAVARENEIEVTPDTEVDETINKIREVATTPKKPTTPIEIKSTPLEGFRPIETTATEANKKAEVLRNANANNPIEFLRNVSKKGGVKQKVADLLIKSGNVGTAKVSYGRYGVAPTPNQRFAGRYNRNTNEILVNLDERDGYVDEEGNHDVESTLLHELGHAVFANKIANKEVLNQAESKAVRDLEGIYNKFVSRYRDSGLTGNTANALNNVQEFSSEVLVNPEVQQLVEDMSTEGSLLEKVLQYILNFLTGKELNPYSDLSQAWKSLNTLTGTTPENIEQKQIERVKQIDEQRTEQREGVSVELKGGTKGKIGGKPIPASDSARRGAEYRDGLERVYRTHPQGKAVTVKELEFYQNPETKLFMAEDASAGVAVGRNGDLVSVFKSKDSKTRIGDLLTDASKIAKTLDAYDVNGYLPTLYSNYGFTPVARIKFNREFAPEGWDFETMGEPDIVFMAKTREPGTKTDYNTIKDNVPYVDDWDIGVELQNKAFNEGTYGNKLFSPSRNDEATLIKSKTIAGTTVGTRSPQGVGAVGSGVDSDTLIDLESARKDPRTYKRNSLLLLEYPHISKLFPKLLKRFNEIRKPLFDIEESIEKNYINLNEARDKIKEKIAKKEGIKPAKVKTTRVDELIAQENADIEDSLKPTIEKIKTLESEIEKQKADRKVIQRKVAINLDAFVDSDEFSLDTADKIYESLVNETKSNLRKLFDVFPKDLVDIAKLWYDGANLIAQDFGKRFNTNLNKASGVLAVFSPQKDWFMNISLAERAMNIWSTKQDTVWDKEMSKQYLFRAGDPKEIVDDVTGNVTYEKGAKPVLNEDGEIVGWLNWKDKDAQIKRDKAVKELKQIEGKMLKDLPIEYQARFIRMYSEVYDLPSYNNYSPNGTKLSTAKTDKGADKKVAWGGYNTIQKAISILSATPETEMQVISDALGKQHKVRSFYNNIVDPQNKSGHVTMDTHAIAALLWLPLSGNSKEVTQNFGGGGTTASSKVGANGLYPAFAEAYRRLAKEVSEELGVEYLPREIQSITWEAVRKLFPAKFKSNKYNIKRVRDTWRDYEQGKKTNEQVRSDVFEIATGKSIQRAIREAKANGEGVGRPDWATDPRYGTDNIRTTRRADDTGRLPVSRRATDGARRPAAERGGVERATGVVSRPTEGQQPRSVLEEGLLLSPAKTAETNQFEKASADSYVQGLPLKVWRAFQDGNLRKPLQRVSEKMNNKMKKLEYRMASLKNRLSDIAKKDGVEYSKVAETAAKAFARSPDGLSVEQREKVRAEVQNKVNERFIEYTSKRVTEEELGLVNLEIAAGKSIEDAWIEVLDANKYRQFKTYKNRIEKDAIREGELKELKKNEDRAIKEAKEALDSLPENLKKEILEMRNEINELNGDAIRDGIIPNGAKVIINGKKISLDVEEVFLANVDETYIDKLKTDKETIDRLVQFIQDTYISNEADRIMRSRGKRMSRMEAIKLASEQMSKEGARNILETFLNEAKNSPMDGFKKFAEELNMTEAQKLSGLPKIFKEALGQLNDAGTTYMQMVYNIAQSVIYGEGFDTMRTMGLKEGWAYNPDEWNSKNMGPEPEGFVAVKSTIPGFRRAFKGLKVDPIFVEAIEERFAKTGDLGFLYKGFGWGNMMAQFMATAANFPGGAIRQILSGPFFLMHSGMLNSDYVQAFKSVKSLFARDGNKYVERLIELGIFDQEVGASRFKDNIKMMRGEQIESFSNLNSYLKPTKWKTRLDTMIESYQYGDNFVRAVVFEAEKIVVKKAEPNLSERQIEEKASERTLESIPTYVRMNYWGRQFRKPNIQGLMGAFVGFASEVQRTIAASWALAFKDRKSNNPVYRQQGIYRMAGMLSAYSIVPIAGYVFKQLFNISDDEEEAARKTMGFNKYDDVIFWRNKDGGLSYYSLSWLSPYAMFLADPIRAGWEEVRENGPSPWFVWAYAKEAFGSYIDFNIFTGQVVEVVTNPEDTIKGYNPEASELEKNWKKTTHIIDSIIPGTLKKIPELYYSLTGQEYKGGVVPSKTATLLNMFVGRSRDIKPADHFRRKVFELDKRLQNASKLFTRVARDKNKITSDDLEKAYNNANRSHNKIMREAIAEYNGQLVLGQTEMDTIDLLKNGRINKDQIEQIQTGIIQPLKIADSTLEDMAEIDPQRYDWYYQIYEKQEEQFDLYRDTPEQSIDEISEEEMLSEMEKELGIK
jgi:hypothetical protein